MYTSMMLSNRVIFKYTALPESLAFLSALHVESNLQEIFGKCCRNLREGHNADLSDQARQFLDLCGDNFEIAINDQRSTSKSFEPFYACAKKVIELSKLFLFKNLLTKIDVDYHEKFLKEAFERLTKLTDETYVKYHALTYKIDTPDPDQPQTRLFYFNRTPLQSYLEKQKGIYSANDISQADGQLMLELEKGRIAMSSNQLIHAKVADQFLHLVPEKNSEGWRRALLNELKKIETVEEMCAVAYVLKTIQVQELLASCTEVNDTIASFLPYLFTGLSNSIMQEVLLTLTDDQGGCNEEKIDLLNKIFKMAVRRDENLKKWMENRFRFRPSPDDRSHFICESEDQSDKWQSKYQTPSIRQAFVNILNHDEAKINELASESREINPFKLSISHFKKIDERLWFIKCHDTNVKIIQKIYSGIWQDPETIKVFDQLVEGYKKLTCRLTTEVHNGDGSDDRIFDILDRITFGAAGFDLEFEVDACFGLWHLTSTEILRELHLLDNLSDDEFAPKKDKLAELSLMAYENLKSAGIKTLADLRRLRIYNAELLKGHMATFEKQKLKVANSVV